jgi:sporulation protein YlmC with PRC-barrel domain
MEHAGQQPNLAKMSESDFRLEEPWQGIRGLDVYDGNGEQIGSVDDLYVDRDSRLPRFLVVSAGVPRSGQKALLDSGRGG